MKEIMSLVISASITAALLSGIQVLHDTAFAISFALMALTIILLPVACLAPPDTFRVALRALKFKAPFTLAFWFALGYTDHPYMLSASILCTSVYISMGLFKIREEGRK